VPLLPSGSAIAAYHSGRVDDERQVGQRFDVVDDRRLAKSSFDRRVTEDEDAAAALAFDAVNEGCLFAADERASAHLDDDVRVRCRLSRMFVAEQAIRFGLNDGFFQARTAMGVFGRGCRCRPCLRQCRTLR